MPKESLNLFYPKDMAGDLFFEIYISMVRVNDFSHASINSIVAFKETEELFSRVKRNSKSREELFDDEDEFEKYLEEVERQSTLAYFYSDEEFICLYGKSVALMLLYFSTIKNLKMLIKEINSYLNADPSNFYVRQQLAVLERNCDQQPSNIPEIKLLIFKLEGLINITNAMNPKNAKENKLFFISDHVINLGSLCEKIRDIRNKFSHGEWGLVQELIQDESLPKAFKVVKRLYEACESACDWSLVSTYRDLD